MPRNSGTLRGWRLHPHALGCSEDGAGTSRGPIAAPGDWAILFRDAVISILAAIVKQERVRLSERTLAGLERARAKGRVGGRPKVRRDRDRDAAKIRQMRDDGQSYQEIADELGRSRADIGRVCAAPNCSQTDSAPVMLV